MGFTMASIVGDIGCVPLLRLIAADKLSLSEPFLLKLGFIAFNVSLCSLSSLSVAMRLFMLEIRFSRLMFALY